ncbi:uridine-cytidine kinase 2 [Hydra vulgaris]|uniref:uridine/cytidine kinase n=1 Tax=Hydra vulgaris TaxID=6087 RepID=A0ABM4BR74_HYDVU
MMSFKNAAPFFIGVAGGTCCGKTEVCKKICEEIEENMNSSGRQRIIMLRHKNFYCNLNDEQKALASLGKFNFDHPSAFDDELALATIKTLKEGKPVSIPKYDFVTYSRLDTGEIIYPADVILFEGILVLYNKEIRDNLDMKIFIDTDCDTRLARRVLRDTIEHKRDIDSVLSHYTSFVKRSFEDFTLPTKKYADVIIPRGVNNIVAIDLIVEHIRDILKVGHNQDSHRIRKQSENSGSRLH